MNPQHTLVGIYAEKTNEDWSSEYLLNEGMKMRGRTLESSITIDDDFDDLDPIDLGTSRSPLTLLTQKTALPLPEVIEEEEEECEDWDDELGIHEEVKESQDLLIDGFRFIMGQTLHEDLEWMDEFAAKGPAADEVALPLTIPPRCKIVSNLLHGNEEINLVLYPKSIALFSLKLDHDRRQLMAVELDDWLQTMASKQKSKVENAMRMKDLAWLNRIQNQEKIFNLILLRAWSEAVALLWRNKSLQLWDVLLKFSKLLRHFSRSDPTRINDASDAKLKSIGAAAAASLSSADKEQLVLHMSDILRIAALVDASEAVTGQYTKDGVNRPNLHFKFVLNQQFADGVRNKSSSSLTSRTPSLFHEILKYTVILLPDSVEEFAILELQAASHHCVTMLQFQVEGVSWTPAPFTLFKCYIVLYRAIIAAEHSFAKKSRKQERHKSDVDVMLQRLETLKTTLICDLFYLLNAYCPLDLAFCAHLVPALEEIKYSEGGNQLSDDDTENEARERSDNSVKFVGMSTERGIATKSVLVMPGLRETKPREPHQIDLRVTAILNSFQNQIEAKIDTSLGDVQRLTRSNLSFLQTQQQQQVNGIEHLASPDNDKKSAKQIAELLSDKKVDYFDLFYLLSANSACFRTVLMAKYRNISRKHLLKAKVSFSLCLLHSMTPLAMAQESSNPIRDTIESLFLETLVLLDNLSTARTNEVSPPIISPFGILVMEKFAERLVKDLKHKFAISCLESALCAHQLVKTGDDKRIYRHLTTVAQEAGDFQKRLLYQSRVLRITKEEGKPNEFVYIANLISKLFIDAGEFLLAERCLRVVSLIHLGYPLASVEFEFVDHKQLEYHILPLGVEIPSITFLQTPASPYSPSPPGPGGLPAKRFAPTQRAVCDSQQVTSIMHLVDLLIFSNRHHDAIELSLSLLKRKIYPQGRATVLLTLAKCYLKLRLLNYCESTLDRIALEADEIVSSTLFKSTGYQSSDLGPGSARSSTLSVPLAPSKFPVARYHRSIKETKEGPGIKKSPSLQAGRGSRPSRQISPRSASTTPIPTAAGQSRGIGASASVGFVSRVCSYTYMLLRAKCRLAADDPEWALHWLQIALALCPKGKWDRRCQVRYLMGRCYAKLCLRCRNDNARGAEDLARTKKLVELESSYATRAEEEFRHALNISSSHTEDILKQTKAINRIIELHNTRLFQDVVIDKIPLCEALDGKADLVLRSIDGLCRISLQLSGDTCSPLELLRTLVNAAELSWLQGNSQQAFSAWCEAKTLITITYLQPSSTMSWGPIKGSTVSENSRVSFTAGTTDIAQFLPDPKNPLGDIPLPVIAYPPGLLSRLFDLLTRIVRLAFYISPCPLSNNGGALLASWTRMNHAVQTAIDPLYNNSQGIPRRPLSSFARLFSLVDPEGTQIFFPELYISSAHSTILGIYGLESHPRNLLSAQQFQSERRAWAETFSPVQIPTKKLQPILSRPVIPLRRHRRPKTVGRVDQNFPPLLLLLTDELEETAIKDIVRSLCVPGDFDPAVEHKDNGDRPTMAAEEEVRMSQLDGSTLGLVTATAHILSPFEMARRALVLEFDLGSPFGEGTVTALLSPPHLAQRSVQQKLC
jgi:hypothetical protein